ncbi:MAG TPA: FAD-dependent oxidoreductase, partial [Polyangiaceae bacterium LLY-WYZ-15_(1-7)]|nr:FAD-dependent oxidoreductase [Polyangiaceae bacterium LLY-WYZ-15_(1-7)]
ERLAARAPVLAVDTACVVPMRLTRRAPERAFAFRKATKKLRHARLGRAWVDAPVGDSILPALPFHPLPIAELDDAAIARLVAACDIDHGVGPVRHTPGGARAGTARWRRFVESGGLRAYARRRNDPLKDGVSRMSAYLHYGMVSPLRLAREAFEEGSEGARKYLDELLVWRELAHHWCFHVEDPEDYFALPAWARDTLEAHAEGDPDEGAREPLDLETLARARTGDPLWDACQRSLLRHGELHNNVRMTWGKALLRWSRTPREALRRLVDLNHRYALDGRDPASYGGLLWCLGLFDRPFSPPSPVLGQVRSRDPADHARRLDVARYAERVDRPARESPPRVAVIGGGVAGLACARTLVDHGWPVVVFDKGRRAPGGRLSSRWGEGWAIDYGAGHLRAEGPRFARALRAWADASLVAPWEGRFVVREGGEDRPERSERWVALPHMSALPGHLAADLSVKQGVRVAPPLRRGEGWELMEADGRALGRFDAVVIATPAAQAAPLLEASPALAERARAVGVQATCAALVAFDAPLETGWDGARDPGGELAWIARESSKPGRPRALDAWVLHASPSLSGALLEEEKDTIAAALLERFAARLGRELPEPVVLQGHRWRYAQTTQPLGEPCLWDPALRLGACGDGCLGARVEHAWESGVAMAGRILAS